MRMDDVLLVLTLGFATLVFGFLLGMFALARAKNIAKRFDRPPPRLPGLSPEQTFGLGGVLLAAAGMLTLMWR